MADRERNSHREDLPRPPRPRPRELEDWLNRTIYHPLSSRLARRLAATPVTPDMVSLASALMVVGAELAYTRPGWPWPALAGLLLHGLWHVLDGADGDLARMTGRGGPAGEVVDGLCDYAGHIVLYLMLGHAMQPQLGMLAWLLVVAAGASRIAQANFHEVQRRQYLWWAYGTPWLGQQRGARAGGRYSLVAALVRAYLALAARLAPDPVAIDAVLAPLAHDGERLARARLAVRAQAREFLPRFGLLGANWRTLLLAAAMLARVPAAYFLYEAVVLNVLLAGAIAAGARRTGAVAQAISGAGGPAVPGKAPDSPPRCPAN